MKKEKLLKKLKEQMLETRIELMKLKTFDILENEHLEREVKNYEHELLEKLKKSNVIAMSDFDKMETFQDKIIEKRLEAEFDYYLQQFLEYCCLDEAFDNYVQDKNDLRSELLKTRLNLENFFKGSLLKTNRRLGKCDPKRHSFYIHVHKTKQHVAEIRISGHYNVNRIGNEVYKINRHKYNVLYIDYSIYFGMPKYEGIVNIVTNSVTSKIDYVCLKQTSRISINVLVNAIMNVILNYLLNNKLAQASKDRLQVSWFVI